MSTVITVTPNPLLNFVTSQPISADAVNRVSKLEARAEGKSINVGRLLANFGHNVICSGFAGGPSGLWLRQLVRDAGMKDALVETAAPLRVGFMSPPSVVGTHPTTILASGFAVSPAEVDELIQTIETQLDSTDARLVICSGSVPDAHPSIERVYSRILEVAAKRDVPCWVDSYGPALKNALECPFPPAFCKPNKQEYQRTDLAPEVWSRAGEVHLTDGDKSVLVSKGGKTWRVTPPSVEQVNPIGCGDSYVAGLAHAFLSGCSSFEERIRVASACGAFNASTETIASFQYEEIVPLLHEVRIEEESS